MAGSLFDGDITADDAFEVAVLGAEEEGAFLAQGFGAASDAAIAHADGDVAANGAAVFFPFVGDVRETTRVDAGIIVVQFPQDGRGESGRKTGLPSSALREVAWWRSSAGKSAGSD